MKLSFDEVYENWLATMIIEENNPRRRELLKKGLSHGTVTFLRKVWFPVIGNLNDLYPEYEVRDLDNKYRYLDIAYMPGGAKGCIEIQDYSSHARDIETNRFKDLCMKQALLTLDDWLFLPIAYLSIRDDPSVCKKLVLSFVGKLLSIKMSVELTWAEAETLRFARRLMRPFEPRELASHLLLSENRIRVILRSLVAKNLIIVTSGKQRYRTYRLNDDTI
ncbi:transcriptional regulator [Paenibacillus sp. D2_2]|uniref:transcriptional regulator n=1 Tax=Paenibacillus sp. D2_2 TaxID=3073092 RepID=UPI0028161594|nr:transcriptional regulator [Paenibacillus sp. D2_2]WMT39512.1 transcriptional regulator [Paenibacillus sp. D2_2]